MIICNYYRFIFLKTEKTASASLLSVFKRIAADVGEVYPAHPAVRRRLLRERGSLERVSFVGGWRAPRRLLPAVTGLHAHAQARDVRAFVGPDTFDRYMIVTSERNPYDRQVSLFNHRRRRSRGDVDLARFSECMESSFYNLTHHNRLHNWDVYTIDGSVCADHVIRFETLQDDYRAFLNKLGVDAGRYELPHEHDGQRADGTSYRDYYTSAARRLVADWYHREIEHFGYGF